MNNKEEKVVCIHDPKNNANKQGYIQPPVQYGKVYTVHDKQYCIKCGILKYDVGIPLKSDTAIPIVNIICNCGHLTKAEQVWSIDNRLFAPLQYEGDAIKELTKNINQQPKETNMPSPIRKETKKTKPEFQPINNNNV